MLMLMLGSCLALNLSYSGCCVESLSPNCSNNGCFCDQKCHSWNDCCSDIADIGCHPESPSSPTVSPTQIDALGKTNQNILIKGFDSFLTLSNIQFGVLLYFIHNTQFHLDFGSGSGLGFDLNGK